MGALRTAVKRLRWRLARGTQHDRDTLHDYWTDPPDPGNRPERYLAVPVERAEHLRHLLDVAAGALHLLAEAALHEGAHEVRVLLEALSLELEVGLTRGLLMLELTLQLCQIRVEEGRVVSHALRVRANPLPLVEA